jgi:HlyD family secretion protein
MAITAPLDGLTVRKTTWKSGTMGEVQEGEEVRPGVPILEVVGRACMQVRARINQADGHLMRAGMPAVVHLDAYPGLSLPGRLEQLTPIAGASDLSPRVRFFVGIFSVASDEARLMPDLSSGVDVELARVKGALVVPRDALRREGDRWFVVAPGGQRQQVQAGPMNDLEAVIQSGVAEGSRVARHTANLEVRATPRSGVEHKRGVGQSAPPAREARSGEASPGPARHTLQAEANSFATRAGGVS